MKSCRLRRMDNNNNNNNNNNKLHTDRFTDEDLSLSAVTDSSLQGNENLEHFILSDSSHLKLEFQHSSQPST
jgi:hypothetical protein